MSPHETDYAAGYRAGLTAANARLIEITSTPAVAGNPQTVLAALMAMTEDPAASADEIIAKVGAGGAPAAASPAPGRPAAKGGRLLALATQTYGSREKLQSASSQKGGGRLTALAKAQYGDRPEGGDAA